MNPESGDPSGIGDRPQDDFVSEYLAGPSERPVRTITLSGLLGNSDRPGYRRLYFTKQLDYYAEFAMADVLSVATIGRDQPPFVGLEATRATLRRGATVRFTQVESAEPLDTFDLDLRLGPSHPTLKSLVAGTLSCHCHTATCVSCETCETCPPCDTDNTCITCNTCDTCHPSFPTCQPANPLCRI
ncbi:hypothetical protein [Kitasatospora sp. NPDC058190]|uniref:hypothetical protein n=1 Tax=Kitasatospora sp. NPDC058190 TaxID=3346371 RepID=UPI0036DCF267